MALIVDKCQQFDDCDNEKGQSLDNYKSNGKVDRYIFLLFTALPLVFQQESNRLSDLDKEIKNLIHFV